MTAPWMRKTLQLAAIYNLLWGAWVILRPNDLFYLSGIPLPTYPSIWQCVGMIVGVYGIGYAIASRDPLRHWPITLVGFLGKIFGPIGFFIGLVSLAPDDVGYLPPIWGVTILTNDLIWWIPFAMILYAAFKASCLPEEQTIPPLGEAMDLFQDQHGNHLRSLAADRPLMLLFLRHGGCTFCREALADIQQIQEPLQAKANLAIVHMGSEADAAAQFAGYGLENVSRVSDPSCQLFRSFGLTRGSWRQLFGAAVWGRGAKACLIDRHGVGKLAGDGFQMPGLFLVKGETILNAYRHENAADRPDYYRFVIEGLSASAS